MALRKIHATDKFTQDAAKQVGAMSDCRLDFIQIICREFAKLAIAQCRTNLGFSEVQTVFRMMTGEGEPDYNVS